MKDIALEGLRLRRPGPLHRHSGAGEPVRPMRAFPDATFTDVVRANADTLYSSLWFDVRREPLVIGAPDSGGRWTERTRPHGPAAPSIRP